jgi:hypothetical protein
MLGAEMSFYVQGMEYQPDKVITILMDYYAHTKEFQDLPEFRNFERYDKATTSVNTPPWYNKEIFIKLFMPAEGRNLDNRHPYPYVSVQVRFDRQTKENVTYSWEKAIKNYLRK